MFQFHSIPQSPPYRAMASSATSPPPSTKSTPTTATPTAETTAETPTTPFRFLDLPLELREHIYSLYFRPADRLHRSTVLESRGFHGGVYVFEMGLLRTSKVVCQEARRVWRREVPMVKIATPWPSAVNHISSEGLVPIVCADASADTFTAHHALIQITAPFHQADPAHTVVLLLSDLPLFTQTWYYSALSYPMLNDRLSTTLALRDPDMDDIDVDTAKTIPLPLQRQLLLPFSCVKGLYALHITGFDKPVERALRTAIAVPPPTLQQSCESATTLLHAGDAQLARGPDGATEALETYTRAFHAIHILIEGRTRRVLADSFFHAQIPRGAYAGQSGMTVRVVLRLKLVARVLRAYLVLGEWGEAAFWGMRSVRIMSEAVDTEFEDFLAELVGGDDVACVYIRAGIALYKMQREAETETKSTSEAEGQGERERWREELKSYSGDDMADTARLFRASLKHLKTGPDAVRREVEAYGVPRELVQVFSEPVPARSEAGSVTVNVDPADVGFF